MYVLIITSESIDPLDKLEVLRALEQYGDWEPLAPGVYAIKSHANLDDVKNDFRSRISASNNVSVVPLLEVVKATPLPGKVKEWIKERLDRLPQAHQQPQ